MNLTRWGKVGRGPSSDDGVFGDVITDTGWRCVSVEKPDLGNHPDTSCIPKGAYEASWEWSEKHGCYLYHLRGVKGRSVIEIHAANVHIELRGCLALGARVETFEPGSIHSDPPMPPRAMKGVIASAATLNAFHKEMQDAQGRQEPFLLTIE